MKQGKAWTEDRWSLWDRPVITVPDNGLFKPVSLSRSLIPDLRKVKPTQPDHFNLVLSASEEVAPPVPFFFAHITPLIETHLAPVFLIPLPRSFFVTRLFFF